MTSYLVKPRLMPYESIYSHLLRCAIANKTSPKNIANKLGVLFAHQLKPAHHHNLDCKQVTTNYSQLFDIDLNEISGKFITSTNSNNNASYTWHGLNFSPSDLRISPRYCPVCLSKHPGVIREQWYLDHYNVCPEHLCDMIYRSPCQVQFALPFKNDLIINISTEIDALFNTKTHNPDLIQEISKTIHDLKNMNLTEIPPPP